MQNSEFPIKERLVWVTDKKTGVKYQERRRYQYDPERKYNRPISSERTGLKLLPGEDTPVRSRAMRKRNKVAQTEASVSSPDIKNEASKIEEPTIATRYRTGASDILNWAVSKSKLADALHTAYDKTTAEKMLTVANFMVQEGDPICNIDDWQLEHDAPYREGLSADGCYELFEQLGHDESGMQALFKALGNMSGDAPVVAFDSTTVSTYSESRLKETVRQGYNKAGDGLDTFKLLSFFSVKSELPISFEIQPGNLPDIKSVANALIRVESYGVQKPTLVADNGFFSKNNVCQFCRSHICFIMRATLEDKWIYNHLDDIVDEEHSLTLRDSLNDIKCSNSLYEDISGATVSSMTELTWEREKRRGEKQPGQKESKKFRLYYHYYRNESKALLERNIFKNNLCSLKDRLENIHYVPTKEEQKMIDKFMNIRVVKGNKRNITLLSKECEEEMRDFGIFVLISNRESNPWKALELYRKRNIIETSYRIEKTDLDGTRPRLWDMCKVRGKEICRMIALGILFYINKAKKRVQNECFARSCDTTNNKAERDKYDKLLKWLKERSIKRLLSWYDCTETVKVNNNIGRKRWTTESIARDQLFLQLLKEDPMQEA